MDKYEFNIKVEQIKKLVGKSDYETAMKIADTIDWRRVRNTNLLSMVAMVYEKNEDYEEAKEILLLAYERAPIGKRLLYKLAELAIKEGNVDEAEAYYREFSDLAGDDPRQQLLRYLILKEKGAPAQQLIHSLESYTTVELDERWLYELAELYSMAGMTDRCVETCDRIMLMFGLGKYVEKAMDLKTRYAPLSGYQRDLVENRDKYEAKLRAVEQEYGIGGRVNVLEPEEEYDEDGNMPEQPGYYGNGNMPGQPGYYEAGNMPGQPGDYGAGNMPGQPGYYEGGNVPGQPGYYEAGNIPGQSGYYENGNVSGQPGYYEDGNLSGQSSYYENENMPGQSGYYEDGNVSGQPGYPDEEIISDQSGYYEDENESSQSGYYGDENEPERQGYRENRTVTGRRGDRNDVGAPVRREYPGNRNTPVSRGYYEDDNDSEQSDYYEEDNGSGQPGYYEEDNISERRGYYEDSAGLNESGYFEDEEDPEYDDSENGAEQKGYDEEEIAARLEEAAVQENLAKEMSKISYQDSVSRSVPEMENTRVLDDIRRVGHPAEWNSNAAGVAESAASAVFAGNMRAGGAPVRLASAMPRPHGVVRMPAVEEDEPVVEEEIMTEAVSDEAPADDTRKAGTDDGDDDRYSGPVEEAGYEAARNAVDPEAQSDSVSNKKYPEGGKNGSAAQTEEWPEFEDIDGEDEEADPPVLNHLMIEARTPEKGLKTAVEALKQIHLETGVKNPVARITGSKLSKRGVLASAEKLAGKDLVIEEAGDMTAEAIAELNELMNRDSSGMIVVLIDNPRQMEKLHQEQPELASKFECIGTGEVLPETEKPVETPKSKASVTPLYAERQPELSEKNPERSIEQPYKEEACQEGLYQEDSYQRDSYQRDSYEEGQYDSESYEEEPYEEPAPQKEKKGGFWKRKKPVYEEMEPEDSYEDDDYYVEETDERVSVRADDGPGSHGEEMDIDEFAQYACRYANEIDCSITGKSMLALYERIEIMEEDGVPLTRANAEDLIEEAADHAEKPTFGKRIKGIFSSKYDKDGLLILKEEHFIY